MIGWLWALLKLVIVIGLCTLLSFAASRYAPQILFEHHQTPIPTQLYWVARDGSEAALTALTRYGRQQSNNYWLKEAGRMGDSEAFYQLALREKDNEAHQDWLYRAANTGHARAQYDLALLSTSLHKQQQWLKASAQQDYVPALMTLAQWHLLHEEFDAAQPLLEQAAPHDGESGFMLARLLWRQGRYEDARQWFASSAQKGFSLGQRYLDMIDQYWQVPLRSASAKRDCSMRLQPVATSLTSAYRIQRTMAQFKQDQRLTALPVCTLPMLWVAEDQLACDENWQGSGRLGCDEGQLAHVLKPVREDLTHVLVMAEEGKANVHNGIMYLDVADSYSVFVHELAHFVGFVDEYPVSDTIAEHVCQVTLTAPNVLVQPPDADNGGMRIPPEWREADSEWSLSPSRTCDNHDFQAYKLTSRMTFMEFHDVETIPDVYLELWRQRLISRHDVIPAYINFAQALQQKRQWQAADIWWQLAMAFDGSSEEAVSGTPGAASSPE